MFPGRGILALAFLLATGLAQAQTLDMPQDVYNHQQLRIEGDKITFCVVPNSMTADFDTAVAKALAATLLVKPVIVPVDPILPTPALDYQLPLQMEDIYRELADNCDAFMDVPLVSGAYPDWMTVTRPYWTSANVFAVTSKQYQQLSDLPRTVPIGSRMTSDGDLRLTNYLQALPANQRWKRFAYYFNDLLLNRLLDGTVGVALIWEPALYHATDGNPGSKGIRTFRAPFSIPDTQISIGLFSSNSYLADSLSQAIDSVRSDGTIDALAVQYKLAAPKNGKSQN